MTILARDTVSFDQSAAAISSVADTAVGNGGDINVTARSIRLDNRGELSAKTASGQGGNINLQAQDLLVLRHSSQISTSAGTKGASGDGGNINIDTQFIVAFPSENSDITANAFTGNGGQVEITAQSIFGLEPLSRQELQTLLGSDNPSELDPSLLPSNDITAISQTNPSLSRQVALNTPDIDPSQGLAFLPAELVDVSNQIAQSCPAGRGQGQSEFIVTGRGGLPDNPSDSLSSDTVWTDLRQTTQLAQHRPSSEEATAPTNSAPTQIVEAQGWVINDKAEVVLTATAPSATPHVPWIPSATCHTSETSS